VLGATRSALEEWRGLGLAGSLENAVHEAIGANRVAGTPGVGAHADVYVDEEVVVRVRRARSLVSGRKAWLPVAVTRVPR
jgi:hypothetical protein